MNELFYDKEIQKFIQIRKNKEDELKAEVDDGEEETLIIDLTEDMYCGSFLDFEEWDQNIGSLFSCILCCGIVFNPV
jgi:hypothetical protein